MDAPPVRFLIGVVLLTALANNKAPGTRLAAKPRASRTESSSPPSPVLLVAAVISGERIKLLGLCKEKAGHWAPYTSPRLTAPRLTERGQVGMVHKLATA